MTYVSGIQCEFALFFRLFPLSYFDELIDVFGSFGSFFATNEGAGYGVWGACRDDMQGSMEKIVYHHVYEYPSMVCSWFISLLVNAAR